MFAEFGVINFWTYLAGATVLVLIPGPNTLFVLKNSASFGIKVGYLAAIGVFIGDAILISLSYAGIATLMQTNPILFSLVRWFGAVYLLWMGLKMLYSTYRSDKPTAVKISSKTGRTAFKRSILLSVTNPKAIIFYVSFFVQFIDIQSGHTGAGYFILAVVLELISLAYLSFLIFFGTYFTRVVGSRKWFKKIGNTLFGLLFLGFAARLATLQ